jgi:AcrR family transcriptional regulator
MRPWPSASPSGESIEVTKPTHHGPRDERGVVAARILSVARASFAAHGYAGTSLRSVGRDADVDPGLVSYYFKDKRGLLDAALAPPPGWTEAIATAAAVPMRLRGAALVRTMIDAWEDPVSGEFLRSTILTAAHEPIALQRLASAFAVHILDAVSSRLDDGERLVRASLAASQIVGLAMMRYVWKVGAMATMPSDQAIALVAPTVQRYLNGKLIGLDQ